MNYRTGPQRTWWKFSDRYGGMVTLLVSYLYDKLAGKRAKSRAKSGNTRVMAAAPDLPFQGMIPGYGLFQIILLEYS